MGRMTGKAMRSLKAGVAITRRNSSVMQAPAADAHSAASMPCQPSSYIPPHRISRVIAVACRTREKSEPLVFGLRGGLLKDMADFVDRGVRFYGPFVGERVEA